MNLSEVRSLFVERSGRQDLVTATGADNGANFFIQSGQKFLDRLVEMDKSWARKFYEASSGDYYVILENCRAIKRVWFSNSDGRIPLEKVSLEEFRNAYSDPPDVIDSGTPSYYTPISLRTSPDDSHVIIDWVYGSKLTDTATQDFTYNGILFTPPTDEDGLVEVFGLFYHAKLENDSDENFWSVVHPEVLLLGALYQLEVSYRNTEGAKDWLNAIMLHLDGLEKDWVEQDIAEVDQMEG